MLQGVSNNGLSNPWSEVWTTWESDNRRSSQIVLFLKNRNIKGTVRPDWICMRVVSMERPLKGHQPLYVFNFWATSCKNDSNLLLVRITVCIESCLAIGWRTSIWKNPPKCTSILVWIAEWWNSLLASRKPKNNWCLSRIFGAWFGEKDRGLSTCKPWSEQAGELEAFLHGAAQNFELLSNIQNQK